MHKDFLNAIVVVLVFSSARLYAEERVADSAETVQRYLAQANQFVAQERYEEAMHSYEAALQLEGQTEYLSRHYFDAAVYYSRSRDYQEAIAYFNKCLEINPGFAAARILLQMVEQADKNGGTVQIERQSP
jgi:tetratricopeptide (TPR) repeat protein